MLIDYLKRRNCDETHLINVPRISADLQQDFHNERLTTVSSMGQRHHASLSRDKKLKKKGG
jgi:hypothetical protein